ncbi:TetR/AcrR family transcriptional regulator [Sphingopyxis sp.]|uniref:TetR/AcrR family transcriptional regulator n=1 Tax=Sphingopyxis sp. TaxID=1908224 RepID=UPI00260C1530|nr:TetR/AcrR family transcriptional regulator [Sphingopyxis sp.]MCW0199166.1 TetR/AcrR family transcriptional regulator [Sphingopyxis sp.]
MEVTAVGDRDTTAGRPRQAELDDRIKQSAVAILGAHGFAGLSINRICQHAGIPRPTFYRRWPSAVAALVDAFNDRFDDALLADSGDAAADLLAFAIAVRNRYDDPVVGTCLPAIYEARRVAPDLIAPIIDAQRQRRKANVATLTRALGEQGITPVLSSFEINFAIAAAIDQGYLARRPVADDFLHRLVTALLR